MVNDSVEQMKSWNVGKWKREKERSGVHFRNARREKWRDCGYPHLSQSKHLKNKESKWKKITTQTDHDEALRGKKKIQQWMKFKIWFFMTKRQQIAWREPTMIRPPDRKVKLVGPSVLRLMRKNCISREIMHLPEDRNCHAQARSLLGGKKDKPTFFTSFC